MEVYVKSKNRKADEMFDFEGQERTDGSPAKIKTEHFEINFQCGPIKEVGVNGCQVDDILKVCLDRLKGFQNGPFASPENAQAIIKLEECLMWQEKRTKDRVARDIEGLNNA